MSTLPWLAAACSSVRPTVAMGGELNTALGMAS